MLTPDFEQFCRLWGAYDSVPLGYTMLSDRETPVTLYARMARRGALPFLLESVEGNEQHARYSFLGCNPRERIELRHGSGAWREDLVLGTREPIPDIFTCLEGLSHDRGAPPVPGLPPFTGGALGYVAYEAVSLMEDVDVLGAVPDGSPLLSFLVYDTVFAFDHLKHTLTIATHARGDGTAAEAHARALAALETAKEILLEPAEIAPLDYPEGFARRREPASTARSGFSREDFEAAVTASKEHILAGDIFQVVLSRRLECSLDGRSPLDIYRILRLLNPSPYMYLLDTGGLTILGTSPEALVKVTDGVAEVMPIAGTRRRGADEADDAEMARELLDDEKENAEHVMLVDLARNDLGRVCEYGSVAVAEFRRVERYSHVMHLVSRVQGRVREGVTPVGVFRSCFPAGTVSGAPKIRAMQIIEELEPLPRGVYAGAIAYLSFTGNLDSCIAIRTMLVRDGVAFVQAGAGIVADSVPAREYQETVSKAGALLSAVEAAPGRRS
ncbi:MAG: anthranilate synthase component I family protein [Candidatus Wallbacteria bacterium]|nr:anthranilate synthase component I family protein [Candidatus Wallbacteria bacterium]